MTPESKEKWRTFNYSSVQGTGGSPMGPDPENMVGDQNIGRTGRPGSCGLKVRGKTEHCRVRTRQPW
jgi:hypothetical protein